MLISHLRMQYSHLQQNAREGTKAMPETASLPVKRYLEPSPTSLPGAAPFYLLNRVFQH